VGKKSDRGRKRTNTCDMQLGSMQCSAAGTAALARASTRVRLDGVERSERRGWEKGCCRKSWAESCKFRGGKESIVDAHADVDVLGTESRSGTGAISAQALQMAMFPACRI